MVCMQVGGVTNPQACVHGSHVTLTLAVAGEGEDRGGDSGVHAMGRCDQPPRLCS